MKRNASEFASSATQPHLVPTLWSQLMVPTLCSQHRFHFWRTPVPPRPKIFGPNCLVPTLRSELCGPNFGPTSGGLPSPPSTLWSHLSGPNSPVLTLRCQLSGPNCWSHLSGSNSWSQLSGPSSPVPTLSGPNSLVPTLRSQDYVWKRTAASCRHLSSGNRRGHRHSFGGCRCMNQVVGYSHTPAPSRSAPTRLLTTCPADASTKIGGYYVVLPCASW